jgi:hypothetical protein
MATGSSVKSHARDTELHVTKLSQGEARCAGKVAAPSPASGECRPVQTATSESGTNPWQMSSKKAGKEAHSMHELRNETTSS